MAQIIGYRSNDDGTYTFKDSSGQEINASGPAAQQKAQQLDQQGAAAPAMPAADTPSWGQSPPQITLSEEEVVDVSLGTFYVFDKEDAGGSRLGERVARACGGCGRGCGGCRGCRGCGVRGCGGCGCGGCGGGGCCLSWGACRWWC